ncbi:hypothetical protein ASPBRDRAFT_427745 [Aspergillus brasiliensis CBS 101740]|uniref:Uncharacterized protein n=1 Tax=Aspergillus brasiliensis (strain CBS 101740 / IMI 381727 / IBT 21946) TaxID=767769 RepID=A0A1L9U3D6_ASPBC|nr:hypothetical protein ASPBRDRAFT_427745 [Aspergillus brasiliensis CBS 101740]
MTWKHNFHAIPRPGVRTSLGTDLFATFTFFVFAHPIFASPRKKKKKKKKGVYKKLNKNHFILLAFQVWPLACVVLLIHNVGFRPNENHLCKNIFSVYITGMPDLPHSVLVTLSSPVVIC